MIAIFSPHHDDAAISLGGAIAAGALAKPLVVTVFSLSNFTRWGNADLALVSARRASENRRALSDVANLLDLDFPDLPLRTSDAPRRAAVRSLLVGLISASHVSLFPAPSPHAHPDHAEISRVAVALLPVAPIGFYEDLPYVSPGDFPRFVSQHSLVPLRVTCSLHTKAQMLLRYSSQLGAASVAKLVRHTALIDGERLAFRRVPHSVLSSHRAYC